MRRTSPGWIATLPPIVTLLEPADGDDGVAVIVNGVGGELINGAPGVAYRVTVATVVGPARGVAAYVALTPAGRPDVERVRSPLDPPKRRIETWNEAIEPWRITRDECIAVAVKDGFDTLGESKARSSSE